MKAETLRKSILQYAIQGKLVPQIDSEEPASELLKKIKAEKTELIKQGKIKKSKMPLPPIADDEKLFDIPTSWEWVRFDTLVNFNLGKTPDRKNSQFWNDEKYNWVSIADMNDKDIVTETKEKVSQYAFDTQFKNGLSVQGTLLMSFKLTIGKVSILDNPAFHNEAIISIYPFFDVDNITKMYFFYLLGIITTFVDSTGAIKGSTLNSDKMKNMIIPIPPLEEQKRIVARIEELMLLVNEYEKNQIELDKLEKEFPEKLKKSILQYAIQGKLLSQIDSEEPASELLKKIKAEKAELIKQGKIKKSKTSLTSITDDEKPFDIPNSWEWVRLGCICTINGGGTPKTTNPEFWKDGTIPWVTPADLGKNQEKYIARGNRNITSLGLAKSSSKLLPAHTILFSSRAPIGHIAISLNEIATNQGFQSAIPFSGLYYEFAYYLMKHKTPEIQSIGTGTTFVEISGSELSKIIVTLPPFEEQKRIVARIEELFELIDLIPDYNKK